MPSGRAGHPRSPWEGALSQLASFRIWTACRPSPGPMAVAHRPLLPTFAPPISHFYYLVPPPPSYHPYASLPPPIPNLSSLTLPHSFLPSLVYSPLYPLLTFPEPSPFPPHPTSTPPLNPPPYFQHPSLLVPPPHPTNPHLLPPSTPSTWPSCLQYLTRPYPHSPPSPRASSSPSFSFPLSRHSFRPPPSPPPRPCAKFFAAVQLSIQQDGSDHPGRNRDRGGRRRIRTDPVSRSLKGPVSQQRAAHRFNLGGRQAGVDGRSPDQLLDGRDRLPRS